MAVTSTQEVNSVHVQMAAGAYISTSTAAAFTITTGFKPLYVKVVNVTVASESLAWMEWIDGMPAASGLKLLDAGSSEAGTTYVTTLGITQLDYGFTVGLDTDVNVISEQLHWIAIG